MTATIFRTLKNPSRGTDVEVLQTQLFAKGYLKSEDDIDGIFLSITESAVKQFQKENGLRADGIVGIKTATALGLKISNEPEELPAGVNKTPFQYEDGTPEFYLAAYKWLTIDKGFEQIVFNAAKKLISNLEIYQDVADELEIEFKASDYTPGEFIHPAVMIGAIHNMESSQNFQGVLHNGERILGTGKKTTLVPKGRGPFRTWKEAAVDALTLKGIESMKDWSVQNVLKTLERFNGTGYLKGSGKNEYSPYLWAQSSINDNFGKYVADGKFSSTANANGQTGAATLIREVYRQLQPTPAPVIVNPEFMGTAEKVIAKNPKIEPRMINRAVKFLDNPAIKNEKYFVAVNFSLHESVPRLYVFDIASGEMLADEKCAVGKNSDKNKDGWADSFSNVSGSFQSSLGAILTGRKFHNPKWKHVYLLYGLEPKLNGNIQKREILLHSTKYVDDKTGTPIGETLGCLGLSEPGIERIEPYIKDGLIYVWASELEA